MFDPSTDGDWWGCVNMPMKTKHNGDRIRTFLSNNVLFGCAWKTGHHHHIRVFLLGLSCHKRCWRWCWWWWWRWWWWWLNPPFSGTPRFRWCNWLTWLGYRWKHVKTRSQMFGTSQLWTFTGECGRKKYTIGTPAAAQTATAQAAPELRWLGESCPSPPPW